MRCSGALLAFAILASTLGCGGDDQGNGAASPAGAADAEGFPHDVARVSPLLVHE